MDLYGNCVDLPDGVEKEETAGLTISNLRLQPGYFRFTSDSSVVYRCNYEANCPGGTISNSTNTYDCMIGSGGPLCNYCLTNW